MKISVAMATYKGAGFVVEQMESIRTQTRAVDEVIICDDRSPDQTAEVIEKYISEHHLEGSWHLEVNPENLGYASNFIGALKKTTGDLIFFCDQDDIWLPNRVAEMEAIMTENQGILLLGSEFEPFSDSSDALEVPKWELKQQKNDKSLEKKSFCAPNIFIGSQGCTMCMRRELLDRIMDYWYPGWAHDEFVWKLALCLDGLYMYHAYTLRRRLHSANASLNKMHRLEKRVKFLEELIRSHEATLAFAKAHGLDRKKIKLLEQNVKATKMRVALLRDKKYLNTVKLLFGYSHCYHKKRSIPVELFMAMKQ